jgi:hypothetical protein
MPQGQQDIDALLYAALSGNLAWGIIDTIMYVISKLGERGRVGLIARAIAAADGIRTAAVDEAPTLAPSQIRRNDVLGAFTVFLLVAHRRYPSL